MTSGKVGDTHKKISKNHNWRLDGVIEAGSPHVTNQVVLVPNRRWLLAPNRRQNFGFKIMN